MAFLSFVLRTAGLLLLGIPAIAGPARAQMQWVTFPSGNEELRGALYLPKATSPYPAVIALHGCGGLSFRKGGREEDWAQRLNSAGYAVLFPDSFGSRELKSQCRVRKRTIRAGKERIADAHGALAYLQTHKDIRPDRIILLGWSNGGATIINSVPRRRKPDGLKHDFAKAIAFYPGCRSAVRRKHWDTRMPLLILTGEADDWTPADACKTLTQRAQAARLPVSIKLYPGAYHNFDHPNMPVRTRKGRAFSADGSGVVHQGTNPAARADAIKQVMEFLPR